jgi:hypothetical protein
VSAAKHTPGPWVVDGKQAWVTQGTRDLPIAALLWPTSLRSEDETMANARLIAAAPELLEALIDLRRQVHEACARDGEGDFETGRAAASIAKATGATS